MTAARHEHEAQIDRIAWAKSLILFGMGVYLTLLMLTGNLDNYINLRFAWLVVVGALLFFLLGLVNCTAACARRRRRIAISITRSPGTLSWCSLFRCCWPS